VIRLDCFDGSLRFAALEAGDAVAELEPLLFAHKLVTVAILQNAELAGNAGGWWGYTVHVNTSKVLAGPREMGRLRGAHALTPLSSNCYPSIINAT
jgi:hypothetical protein